MTPWSMVGPRRYRPILTALALALGPMVAPACAPQDGDGNASGPVSSLANGTDPAASTTAGPVPPRGTGPATTSAQPASEAARGPVPAPAGPGPPVRYRAQVVAEHPHDETSWTQGLEFHDGLLLESTGQQGLSTLRLVEPTTGRVTDQIDVPDELYAEGVTVVDGKAVQLTWKNETLLTAALPDLDAATVARRGEAYDGEGWGLCYDGSEIVMSSGAAELQFRHPSTFELLRTVPVTLDGAPVPRLNELECVDGTVWANVWLTTRIVAIDPATGVVTGLLDVPELVPPQYATDANAVLNGIAHDPATGRFWLTGKLWPVMYEVELVPA